MKTISRSQTPSGFTLVEVMIVSAIIGLLASLAIPNLVRARDTSRLNIIYSNLRALDTAKEQWALDNNQASGTPVTDITVLSNYLRWGCISAVMNETYVPNPIGAACAADLPPGVALRPYGPGAEILVP
jgi:prepilin-type N-terminal cleavage/methylation domain-containing protein